MTKTFAIDALASNQTKTKLQRKRVLFILSSLSGGGSERVVLTILRHLDRSRFEPHLALVDAVGDYFMDVPEDVPVYDLKASRARFAIPATVRLSWKLRPQILFSTLDCVNLVLIFVRLFLPKGLRVVVREGGPVSAVIAMTYKHPRIWKCLYRRFYKKADKIICQADDMLTDLIENFGVPREKAVRIYNPVDIRRIKQLADAQENPYCGDGPHLVAAGRLAEVKGIDLLLKAMVLVRRAFPHAELSVLGKGPLEANLQAESERLGLGEAVHFLGFQANPYPRFKHADLFLLSSRYEGLPNVVLEALALGTPVVATDCPGGIRELADDKNCLRLVRPDDSDAFADSVVKALSEDKSSCPRVSNSVFLERFSVQTIIPEYEALLESVCNVNTH